MPEFVPLQGLETDAGPVIGALVDLSGGPLLVLDIEKGAVRPINPGELRDNREPQTASSPTHYVVMSESGQTGRRRYDSPLHAILVADENRGQTVVAVQGDHVRVLSQEERQQTLQSLADSNLETRIPSWLRHLKSPSLT